MTGRARRVAGIAAIAILVLVVALLGQRFFTEGRRGPAGTPEVGAEPEGLLLRTVNVYFGAADGPGLAAERREVLAQGDLAGDVSAAINELASGPLGRLRPVLPEGTHLHHVFADAAGGVYLDFGPEVTRRFNGGLTAELLALRALARTLSANFPKVTAFVILVDGKPAATLGGHLDISRPLAVADWE